MNYLGTVLKHLLKCKEKHVLVKLESESIGVKSLKGQPLSNNPVLRCVRGGKHS